MGESLGLMSFKGGKDMEHLSPESRAAAEEEMKKILQVCLFVLFVLLFRVL